MLRILAATTALCAVLAQPAHAAIMTIEQDFSAAGNVAPNGSGFQGVTSTSFSDFSTSLGTLVGIGVFFSGTATPHSLVSGSDTGEFISLEPNQPQEIALINGGSNGNTFDPLVDSSLISSDFALFENTGPQAFTLDFLVGSGSLSVTGSGTITYTYSTDPVVQTVPEPDDMAVFAVGLLGLLGWRLRSAVWSDEHEFR